MNNNLVVTNKDVVENDELVSCGRFNLHGTYQQNDKSFDIFVDADAPSAGFSIPNNSSLAIPVENFLNRQTDSYLLAIGIGLCFKDKIILGKRPKNISVAANKYTISGGRISEAPHLTASKELAEEFVILASNGTEDRFVRFSKCHSNRDIQNHAIEQLPYSKQTLALNWIQGIVVPKKIRNVQNVNINISTNQYSFNGIPCVIDEYNTIDILLPCELKLPDGWDIKEIFFLENEKFTSVIATPEELKALPSSQYTKWAWEFINNI